MNINKKDVSKLHSLETRFSKKIIACAITLSIGASAFPISTFAATISGVRFIDSTPFAVSPINNISGNDTVYNVDGYILFKRAGFASQFSTPVVGGNYSINLPDGNYKMWQYVDTSATLLTSSQSNSIQWATEANALNVSILGSSILVSTATGTSSVSSGVIDFPYPNFTKSTSLPPSIFQVCNINNATNRKIVCGDNYSSNLPSTVTACDYYASSTYSGSGTSTTSFPYIYPSPPVLASSTVFIYGNVQITDNGSSNPLKVKNLCNHGTLQSSYKNISIDFINYFVNFTDGSVIASNSSYPSSNGGDVNLKGIQDSAGTGGGELFNNGIIKAGNAYNHTIPANSADYQWYYNYSTDTNIVSIVEWI